MISLLISAPGVIRGLLLKDDLLECLYNDHRDIWESLGSPTGWLWYPPGIWIKKPFLRMTFEWLRNSDPEWLSRAPELKKTFYECRKELRRFNFIGFPTFLGGCLVFVLCFLLFAPPEVVPSMKGFHSPAPTAQK